MNQKYSELRTASSAFRERDDCTVVALAAVTGLPYAVVHKVLAKRGRKHRNGCYPSQWKTALEDLGLTYANVLPLTCGKVKTVISARRWLDRYAKDQRVLIHQHCHVAAYVNGDIVDSPARANSRHAVIGMYLVHLDDSKAGMERRRAIYDNYLRRAA